MTTLDIKTLTDQVERDLRDKPIWRLLYTGIALLGLGLLVNLSLGEADPEVTERWDGPAAVCAAIGGIFIAASWVVRILQRGRREEITQEVTRALAPIEVERARRDMRLMDLFDDVIDRIGRHDIRVDEAIERMRSELRSATDDVKGLLEETTKRDETWQRDVAEAYRLGQQSPRNGPPSAAV